MHLSELSPAVFPDLDLLKPALEIRQDANGIHVLDLLRKKWLRLTPEEWVRQHVLFWLISQTGFPVGLLSIERKVGIGSGHRADVVGFGKNGLPLLLVECKAPGEPISEITAMQAMKYNQQLRARFLWLTNGKVHRVVRIGENGVDTENLGILPVFTEMEEVE